jgi:hypothetical protein
VKHKQILEVRGIDPEDQYRRITVTLVDPHPYFFPFRLAELTDAAVAQFPSGWEATVRVSGRQH